jgi:hypothetical protein
MDKNKIYLYIIIKKYKSINSRAKIIIRIEERGG